MFQKEVNPGFFLNYVTPAFKICDWVQFAARPILLRLPKFQNLFMPKKPELLLPAGNAESFFAALEAGADAVYLGLEQFNARRASNFTNLQLISVLQEAKKRKVLVYIALNTVVKNEESAQLIGYLHFLESAGVDAIIVQDWVCFI
jgi:collagenase-like PrtC family protease